MQVYEHYVYTHFIFILSIYLLVLNSQCFLMPVILSSCLSSQGY